MPTTRDNGSKSVDLPRRVLVYLPTLTTATTLLGAGAFADLCKSYSVVFAFHDVTRSQISELASVWVESGCECIWLAETRGTASLVSKRLLLMLNTARLCQYWIAKRVNPFLQWKLVNRKKLWQITVVTLAFCIPPFLLRSLIRVFTFLGEPNLYRQLDIPAYDLVVVPASAMDAYSDYAITLAKRNNVPSLALVSHWDFFSKKTFLNEYPDIVGVWGAYMCQEAMQDKRLALSTSIQILSAPLVVASNPYSFPAVETIRILYACGSLPYPDTSILLRLSDYINFRMAVDGPCIEIVFKPHPRSKYSLSRSDIDTLRRRSNIVINTLEEAGSFGLLSVNSSDYHDSVLSCHAVITPFSTMGLEFLLRTKPCMFLMYNSTSLDSVYRSCMQSCRVQSVLRHPLSLRCDNDTMLETVFEELIHLASGSRADHEMSESVQQENEMHANGGRSRLSLSLLRSVGNALYRPYY